MSGAGGHRGGRGGRGEYYKQKYGGGGRGRGVGYLLHHHGIAVNGKMSPAIRT